MARLVLEHFFFSFTCYVGMFWLKNFDLDIVHWWGTSHSQAVAECVAWLNPFFPNHSLWECFNSNFAPLPILRIDGALYTSCMQWGPLHGNTHVRSLATNNDNDNNRPPVLRYCFHSDNLLIGKGSPEPAHTSVHYWHICVVDVFIGGGVMIVFIGGVYRGCFYRGWRYDAGGGIQHDCARSSDGKAKPKAVLEKVLLLIFCW